MKKKAAIVIGIFVGVLITWTGIWSYNKFIYFGQFSSLSDGETGVKSGDYLCSTFSPTHFTSLKGNLSVTQIIKVDGDTGAYKNSSVDLLIFPSLFGNDTFQISILDNGTNTMPDDLEYYNLYIDSSAQLIKSSEYDEKMYSMYEDNIMNACEAANDVYGIFNFQD